MTQIINIINTLEKVEVHGSDNMDRLLGCILALKQMAKEEKSDGNTDSES